MTDIAVMERQMETLADRIRERMSVLNKSGAAISSEAGLGRSAVQDILAGHSQSPRLDTLEKLAGALQCSLNYLVSGTPDEAAATSPGHFDYRDLRLDAVTQDIESGVFRTRPKLEAFSSQEAPKEQSNEQDYPTANDLRLPGKSVHPYRLLDNSLNKLGIFKGDILHAASGWDGQFTLRPGQLVILERTIRTHSLEEWSVRQVEVDGQGFRFVPRSTENGFATHEVTGATIGTENTYSLEDGWISVHAIVTGVYREIAI